MKNLIIIGLLTAVLALTEANVVCYYGSWAVYRNGDGQFDVDQIDPFICTHLVFGFAGLDASTNEIKVLDPWNELCDDYGMCAYDRFTGLKKQNPDLTTLLSVGGWNEGSTKYSDMAADPSARASFISSSVALLKEHDFDGLDLDWEYPGSRGGVPADKENFAILMSELSAALHAEGLILTAGVAVGKETIDLAYDVPSIDAVIDFYNIMSYDLHGAWETYTHHQSILYPYPEDEGENLYNNVDYGIQYWISLGATPSKIMMGTPLFGRCWRLDDPTVHGMYAPASQPGSAGPFTYTPGTMGYNELCEHQLTSAWTVVYEPEMNEPYAYDLSFGNTWCSYDSPESLVIKAEYALANGLGGVMTWSIESDDFLGKCHERTFHLTKTLYETFMGQEIPTPGPTTTTSLDPDASPVTTVASTTVTFPTAGPGEHCNEPGINPEPQDCTIFYQCQFVGDGYLETVEFCSEGMLFNPEAMVCDFDYSVCALGDGICANNCPA